MGPSRIVITQLSKQANNPIMVTKQSLKIQMSSGDHPSTQLVINLLPSQPFKCDH